MRGSRQTRAAGPLLVLPSQAELANPFLGEMLLGTTDPPPVSTGSGRFPTREARCQWESRWGWPVGLAEPPWRRPDRATSLSLASGDDGDSLQSVGPPRLAGR